LPGTLAYLVMAVETGGGALLIPGVYSHWGALAVGSRIAWRACRRTLAKWRVFSFPGGGWGYAAFLAVATTAQGLPGSGAFALKDK
jgi:hypothetical protein